MIEEPEQPFPPPPEEDETVAAEEDEEELPSETASEEPPTYDAATTTSTSVGETRVEDATVAEMEDPADDLPTDSAPFPVSSSTASEDSYSGPSTAENSQSHHANPPPEEPPPPDQEEEEDDKTVPDEPPPMHQPLGGRASIPDELEPHQLAQLQDLKESNA